MAKRKGYENIRLADKTKELVDIKTQLAKMHRPVQSSALPTVRRAAPASRFQATTQPEIAPPR